MIDWIRNISFVDPALLILGILPIGYLVYKFLKKDTYQGDMVLTTTSFLEGNTSWKSKFRWIPDILRMLGLLAFIVALARPQLTLSEETEKAEGIDIMLAIDLSSSMLAQDFNPNRLEVSKEVAEDFVRRRKFDRMGLSVFAGEAFSQCPLTTDHTILIDFLQSLAVGTLEDGTAIGMGLATALNRLKDSEAKSKVVILLTDGVNNKGYIAPETAAEIAKQFNIKVYTIGVGSMGTAMSPVNRRSNGEFIYRQTQVQIDEELLKQISGSTGGRYFRAVDRTSLEQIYSYIDTLEKTEIEVNVFKRYSDEFRKFLFLGFIFLGIEFLLRKLIINTLE